MGKLLFVMLASFSVSTDVLLGGNVCNNYSDTGCVSPNSLKDGFYVNQWIVHLPGMAENQVRRLLEDNGFEYLGPIMDGVDLHLVTKKGTIMQHVMPDAQTINSLNKIKQVESVAQMHIFGNSPDEVTSRYYENRVTVLPLDPNLIVLNDGRENWERIKTGEMDIISYSRPTSNTDETSDTELENEDNTLNGNSPNEKLSDEELFNLHLMNKQELLNYNNN